MGEVNCPLYCEDCVNSKFEGDQMVGTDDTGGGPEESFSCTKNNNMYYWYCRPGETCPDFDDGEDYEYY